MSRTYAFAGTTMTVLIPASETGGRFAVLHVIKPVGSSTPPHSHDDETEISYVLSGLLGVETEGRKTAVATSEIVVLPVGRPIGSSMTQKKLCVSSYYAHPVGLTVLSRQWVWRRDLGQLPAP
jgi:glyoxylate utilization-related uncharacterized protein